MRVRWQLRVLALVAVFAASCTSSGDDGAGADVPADWQEFSFPGGSVAVPPDWEEQEAEGEDALRVFSPQRAEGPPMPLRVRVTDRPAAPFEEVPGMVGATLVAQFGDVEPVGEEVVEVPGAEQAMIADFRYEAEVDGEATLLHERLLHAWYGEDRQLQLRTGSPAELWDEDRELVEAVLDTVVLDD